MADLGIIDKRRLEQFLEMESGVVCNFVNRTFSDFMIDSVDVNIYDPKYAVRGESKANRLRTFWQIESNYIVARAMKEMLDYWKLEKERIADDPWTPVKPFDPALYEECKKIIAKIQESRSIENADVFEPNSEGKTFEMLARAIKEGIEKNEPEQVLDRLHAFITSYMRTLCDRHGIHYDQKMPLHSLFGSYVKFLKEQGIFESEMSEKIIKSSIAILESFNDVRNNQSLAHSNPVVLNHNESVLIFNNIANTIRYLRIVEDALKKDESQKMDDVDLGVLSFDPLKEKAALDQYLDGIIDERRGK